MHRIPKDFEGVTRIVVAFPCGDGVLFGRRVRVPCLAEEEPLR